MLTLLLLSLSTAAPASGAPVAKAHGIAVTAPEGWAASTDGTTFVYSAPGDDAQLRVDLFEKEKAGDAQDCLNQVVEKLAAAEKRPRSSFAPTAIDGHPAATQTATGDRNYKHLRVVGCNGKSYFLVDWTARGKDGLKHEKSFTELLGHIRYARPQSTAPAKAPAPAKAKADGKSESEPLAPLVP